MSELLMHAGRDAGRRNGRRTLDWLDWLAGLTMSSVFGDLMSFRSSWASSSIWVLSASIVNTTTSGYVYLSVVGGTRAIAVDGRRVDGRRVRARGRDEVVGLRGGSSGMHQYVLLGRSVRGLRTYLRRPG